MCNTCPILAARVEEQAEEIRQLKAELAMAPWEPPAALQIGRGQQLAALRLLLARDRVVNFWAIRSAILDGGIFRCAAEDVTDNHMKVVVSKLRTKLRAHGMNIETVWGEGYRLPPETRQRLLNWTSERAAA